MKPLPRAVLYASWAWCVVLVAAPLVRAQPAVTMRSTDGRSSVGDAAVHTDAGGVNRGCGAKASPTGRPCRLDLMDAAPTGLLDRDRFAPEWLEDRRHRTGEVGSLSGRRNERSGSLTGTASWFRADGLVAAAGPRLRHALGPHWRGSVVTVCADSCVTVTLSGWCQCYRGERRERLLDLSDDAFARLAPLPVGVVRVRVVVLVPPATDR